MYLDRLQRFLVIVGKQDKYVVLLSLFQTFDFVCFMFVCLCVCVVVVVVVVVLFYDCFVCSISKHDIISIYDLMFQSAL